MYKAEFSVNFGQKVYKLEAETMRDLWKKIYRLVKFFDSPENLVTVSIPATKHIFSVLDGHWFIKANCICFID